MRGGGGGEGERKREGANSNGLVQTHKKTMLHRALDAQLRRRKPAFVTHDNEASLCVLPAAAKPCCFSNITSRDGTPSTADSTPWQVVATLVASSANWHKQNMAVSFTDKNITTI